jgi:hypothetical protein
MSFHPPGKPEDLKVYGNCGDVELFRANSFQRPSHEVTRINYLYVTGIAGIDWGSFYAHNLDL